MASHFGQVNPTCTAVDTVRQSGCFTFVLSTAACVTCCRALASMDFGAGHAQSAAAALCEAAYSGDLAKLRSTIAAGCSPNARDEAGFTALHRCAVAGRIDALTALLIAGASAAEIDTVSSELRGLPTSTSAFYTPPPPPLPGMC
jgi:hypothetical protein